MSQIFNIFPTTIYVGEVENHNEYKTEFLKLYDKFDYEENEISSTVSEGRSSASFNTFRTIYGCNVSRDC